MPLPRSATSSGPEMKLMWGVEALQDAASRLRKMSSDDALMVTVTVLAECCDGWDCSGGSSQPGHGS